MISRRAALAGIAVLPMPAGLRAETFPSRTITIVVPYAPVGPTDTTARLLTHAATAELNQAIVAENRPGGASIVGANAVARAEPDGHMLVLGTTQTPGINQSLIRNCPYDAVRDF